MKLSSEEAQKVHDRQTETWGLERKPFEPDGAYFVRVASHWKDRALSREEALRRIINAENRGPDGAAESAYMVQVARDELRG